MSRFRVLFGISIFWLALSMLFDGINSLVLPRRLLDLTAPDQRATMLGLLSFAGLAMVVQPVAGHWSDRLRARLSTAGQGYVLLLLVATLAFATTPAVLGRVAQPLPATLPGVTEDAT